MWNEPSKKRLNQLPSLYSTQDIPLQEKEVWLHFYICGSDWWAVEFDHEGGDLLFAHAGESRGFESLQGPSGAGGHRLAVACKAEQNRAPVIGMNLAGDQPPVLEPVEDAGEGRAPVPERVVHVSDAARAARREVRQDVCLGLGDRELAQFAVDVETDLVGRLVQVGDQP